jgi:hypothetical protein
MTTRTGRRADEDVLHECLAGIVADRCGPRPLITGIDRKRSDESSSYAADVVTVRLAGGAEVKVFHKQFGHSAFPKEEPGRQRDREVRVYQELLAGAGLGTAGYYDSIRDEADGRFWLLLEFVGGTPLAYCAFEDWVAAAGWLGRLHTHFAGHADRLRGCAFLLRHDADFFWAKAQLALAAVAEAAPPLARRLADVLGRYGRCVEVMAGQPPTLVHGAYKPRHILMGLDARPPRICPVDWELAALGSAFYDLAFLAYGFDPPSLDQLLDAYRREALAHGLSLPDQGEVRRAVDCFRLHRVLKALGGARSRGLPEGKMSKLVGAAERLNHSIG